MTRSLSGNSVLAIATAAARNSHAAPRAKPRHLEAREQRLFVKRWRLDPRTHDLPACAVPNGGTRAPREAALMKAEGVSAGVPDWLLFTPNRKHSGLALEFKSPTNKGRITDTQEAWHRKLRSVGWCVQVVTSAQEAWDVAIAYLDHGR